MSMHTKKSTNNALPTYSFPTDPDTGLHSSAANTLDEVVGGATVNKVNEFGIQRQAGYSDLSTAKRYRFVQDFDLKASATLPLPFTKAVVGTTPTGDFVTSGLGGTYALTLTATDEVQTARIDFADNLIINPAANAVFECRVKLTPSGANPSATGGYVVGLQSAYNSTQDSTTSNVWFLFTGANLNILWETDDGTTDDDDNDSGIDWVKDQYMVLRIDLSDLSAIKFYVDDVLAGTASAPLLDATTKLQPLIKAYKASGTITNAMTVDYAWVEQDRT